MMEDKLPAYVSSTSTRGALVPLLLAIACTYTLWQLVNNLHKYMGIPGPWLSKISGVPLAYHEWKGDRTLWIHNLHIRYGPVVRIAPKELHFNSPEAVKIIYGTDKRIRKDDYYKVYRHKGIDNIFSTLENVENSRRRRDLGNLFSCGKIQSMAAGCEADANVFNRALRAMAISIENSIELDMPVDLQDLLITFSSNIIREMVYGQGISGDRMSLAQPSSHAVQALSRSNYKRLLHKSRYVMAASIYQSLANLYNWLVTLLQSLLGSPAKQQDGYTAQLTHLESVAAAGLKAQRQRPADCVWSHLLSIGQNLPSVVAESRALTIAGTVTTPAVLVYLIAQIAADPELKNALVLELKGKGQSEKCPILDAVCQEGLRMLPPIPMTLPRYTLSDIRIGGHLIPKHTRVGCQAYSIQRLESSFPCADKFDYKRWLLRSKANAQDDAAFCIAQRFWAFSSGARVCPGRHLALAEMRLVLKCILSQFSFQIEAEEQLTHLDAWHEDVTSFTVVPKQSIRATFALASELRNARG